MDRQTEFLEKLKALLLEYNAEIYCQVYGDTHGVDIDMCIDIDNNTSIKVLKNQIDISGHDL